MIHHLCETREEKLNFATHCIHAGQIPDPRTIALKHRFIQLQLTLKKNPDTPGFEYSKTQQPRFAYECCIADYKIKWLCPTITSS